MLLSVDEQGGQCWAKHLREILCKTGFGDVWYFQGVGNEKVFLKIFKQRVIDMYVQEWTEAVTNSERHEKYFQMKQTFDRENYLCNIDRFYFRSCFSKARFGMLPLKGNLNRFEKDFKSKVCPFCKNVLEDENHFLLKCPTYEELRLKFLKNCMHLPFHVIMATRSRKRGREIANFLYFALEKRGKLLER